MNTTTEPYVLFFSRDIFFAGNVRTAATAAGCQLKIVGDIDAQLAEEVTSHVQACIVDLTPLSLEQISSWGTKLSERFPSARKIAFGPHVQTDHFAAAQAAGFHSVIAKGQVAMLLPKLIGG